MTRKTVLIEENSKCGHWIHVVMQQLTILIAHVLLLFTRKQIVLYLYPNSPFFPPTGSQGLVLLTTDSHLMKRSAINDEMMRGHHMSAWPFPLQRCSKVNSCKKVDIPQRVLPSQTLCYLQHKCQLSNRECFACVFLTDYYLHNWQAASLHSAGVCLFV